MNNYLTSKLETGMKMRLKREKNINTAIILNSIISLCLILAFTTTAYAVNMQFLKYSPVASFTSEDFEMLQRAGHKALNENQDGQTIEWKNVKTNNSGSITPLDTSEIDGMHCRKTKITNQAKNRFSHSTFTFCKIDEGWKLLK